MVICSKNENRNRRRIQGLLLGLAVTFVASGCGSLNGGGDEIGEGYLSEDGWDPFADEPRRERRKSGRVTELDVEDLEPVGGASAPVVDAGIGQVASKREQSDAGKRLEGYFKKGDYKKALSSARSLRTKSAPGSGERDVADFITGASLYYLGKFSEGQGALDQHVQSFPNSRHRESALYYQASNHVRLRQWKIGADLLDNYISQYPESLLLEFALFDRATCHFELGEFSACEKMAERIERDFIYSKVRDRVLVMKGDAQRATGNLAGAQASYAKAREAADELKHPDLEARCLANLISVAAARGKSGDAAKYYDAFFKQYEGSKYAAQAARGGLPALKATGKLDSGLKNIEKVLQKMPQKTDASVMNETLTEYAKFYREAHGPEKLLRQLGNLSSSSKGSDRLKEQLIVARLEALETYFPDNEAEIRVFYKEMESRFEPNDLSTANVLKMADYISEEAPDKAVEWYESALRRGGALHQARATLGLAKAQAGSGNAVGAEAGFRKVLETFGSPELAEEATLGIARIATEKKDWSASAYYWQSYLNQKSWDVARGEARTGLEAAKSKGGVAKAPKSSRTMPVKATSSDPVSRELGKAQGQIAAGRKIDAYRTLGDIVARWGDTEGLQKESKVSLSKARLLREDLGVELGR